LSECDTMPAVSAKWFSEKHTADSTEEGLKISSCSDPYQILAGLTSTEKYLPCKFFYDRRGSELFERITELDEYYPSRTEKSILQRYARELMRGIREPSLVEIGSGDCSKISMLLQVLPQETIGKLTYVPLDVSRSALEESKFQLKKRFGEIAVHDIVADFMKRIQVIDKFGNKIICFFGSTIGNLERSSANRFVSGLGGLMKPGERLLLGLDMVKDQAVMERAYNDGSGLTSRFNKNILHVANKVLGTDFDPDCFRHHAFYRKEKQRIEMHLVATRNVTVRPPFLDRDIQIDAGESIHTENSHKFTFDHIQEFASASGLSVRSVYTDDKRWFSLVDYIK
jgi:L-histidine Nalpha-methyltransferase